MNISTKAIVSNSEMIKNYKGCRDKAEIFGKIFVLKTTSRTLFCSQLKNTKGFQCLLSIWKASMKQTFQSLLRLYRRKETGENILLIF